MIKQQTTNDIQCNKLRVNHNDKQSIQLGNITIIAKI